MTTTTEVQDVEQEQPQRELKVADRCDRCQAQAFVLVMLAGGPLLFCGHHFHRHQPALAGAGATVVVDNRKQLTARPSNVNAV